MDISSKAMLASLKITQWTCAKKDKEVTDEVLTQRQAKADAGSFNKRLLAKEQIQSIRQIAGAARNLHYDLTLPWSQDGARILPAAMFAKYDAEMRKLKGEFEVAVRDFIRDYPGYVADARLRLGGLFKAEDYPDANDVEAKFTWELTISPLPTGNDFRVNLSKEMTEHLRAQIEERTRKEIETGTRDVWDRVYKVVQHMAVSLEEYKVSVDKDGKEKKENPFRDTLVSNVRDIAGLLPLLNVTGDPKLNQLATEITGKLTLKEPQELRDDGKARKKVAKDARTILEDMKSLMG